MAVLMSYLPPELSVLIVLATIFLIIYGFMRLFVRMLKK